MHTLICFSLLFLCLQQLYMHTCAISTEANSSGCLSSQDGPSPVKPVGVYQGILGIDLVYQGILVYQDI